MAFFPLYFIMDTGYTNEVSVYKLYLLGATFRQELISLPRQRHALSVSLRSPAPPEGEPLACRATLRWTPKARQGVKERASLTGAAASGQYPLSSCCGSRPQGTTVSGQRKLCSSRVGLTGTPVPPPLGEVALRSNDGEGKAAAKEPLRRDGEGKAAARGLLPGTPPKD